MKHVLLLILFHCLLLIEIFSQVVLYGYVVADTGEPVRYANVYIENSFIGGSTDEGGFYSFRTMLTDSLHIIASCQGFISSETVISISQDSTRVSFILIRQVKEIEEVVITAGSFEVSDKKRNVVLHGNDIGTTAGAIGDITGAMEMLPGTQYNGASNGLFVRGGDNYESKVFIDEMVVQNPYYSPVPDIKQRGRFDPFLFSGTVFSTGGYSAKYGQALSSILLLRSKGLADSTNTGGGIHFYGGRIFHTRRWDKSSAHLDLNYNNMRLYHNIAGIDRYTKSPENYCGKLILRHKIKENGILKFYTNLSRTTMNVKINTLDDSSIFNSFDLVNKNYYFNSSYKHYSKNDTWSFFAGVSYSSDNDEASLDAMPMSEKEHLFQNKFMITNNSLETLEISAGMAMHFFTLDGYSDDNYRSVDNLLIAGFLESDWRLSGKITARFGARFEHSDLTGSNDLAPRVSVASKAGRNGQFSLAAGLFFQQPNNEYIYYINSDHEPEKAIHYVLNYQWEEDERLFRIELFNKQYDDLIRFDGGISVTNNTGYGYARGLDIFWRDRITIPDGEYWISYSFLDTERLFHDYPVAATPDFASRHSLNIVYKHWLRTINTMAGLSYTFYSGRPYYNPFKTEAEFHSDRTRAYHSLNMNLSWITSVCSKRTVVFLSLGNILGRDNILGYKYIDEYDIMIPIKPVSRHSVFMGIFISTY